MFAHRHRVRIGELPRSFGPWSAPARPGSTIAAVTAVERGRSIPGRCGSPRSSRMISTSVIVTRREWEVLAERSEMRRDSVAQFVVVGARHRHGQAGVVPEVVALVELIDCSAGDRHSLVW